MKKLTLTIAIILGMAFGATAQPSGGGLFQRGETYENYDRDGGGSPLLPIHGQTGDQDGNESPLVGGMGFLFGLGVIYLTRKRKMEE